MVENLSAQLRELAVAGHPRGDEFIEEAERLETAAAPKQLGSWTSGLLIDAWMAARALLRAGGVEPRVHVSTVQPRVDAIRRGGA